MKNELFESVIQDPAILAEKFLAYIEDVGYDSEVTAGKIKRWMKQNQVNPNWFDGLEEFVERLWMPAYQGYADEKENNIKTLIDMFRD